jgi:hypothetical protein
MTDHSELVRLLVTPGLMVKHSVWTIAGAQAMRLEMSREMAHKTVPMMVFCLECSNQVLALVRSLLEVVLVSWVPEVVC